MQADASPAALSAKIESMRIAMFTIRDAHGHLIAQPMTHQGLDGDGQFWFFVADDTDLWALLAAGQEVNLSFADPEREIYVSVSGHALPVRDPQRQRALWHPLAAAWFPQGPDDPHLALIRVQPHSAEYWDAHGSRMVQLYRLARAAVTGHPPPAEPGRHGQLRLN